MDNGPRMRLIFACLLSACLFSCLHRESEENIAKPDREATKATKDVPVSPGQRPDDQGAEVRCRDARKIADAGFTVQVAAGDHSKIATIGELWIGGERPLRTFEVERETTSKDAVIYSGKDFRLSVAARTPNGPGELSGQLSAKIRDREINQPVLCHLERGASFP